MNSVRYIYCHMADELRWEQMVQIVADGVTEGLAGSTFRNTTNDLMHIRKINIDVTISDVAPNEFAGSFISKARTVVGGNNEPGFNLITSIAQPATGATPDNGSISRTRLIQFAKGELTLEPNEALFLNVTKSSGGGFTGIYNLGYHF